MEIQKSLGSPVNPPATVIYTDFCVIDRGPSETVRQFYSAINASPHTFTGICGSIHRYIAASRDEVSPPPAALEEDSSR